jgi:predicted 3-demethylubiquinone-9 3-methyltransferase (glyoxalase superfamily)
MSWLMLPNVLGVMLQGKDDKKSERIMEAMLQLKKIDIEGLNKSYAG